MALLLSTTSLICRSAALGIDKNQFPLTHSALVAVRSAINYEISHMTAHPPHPASSIVSSYHHVLGYVEIGYGCG